MTIEEISEVKSRLNKELRDKLDRIKQEKGIEADSEVIRILIVEEWKRGVKK